MIYLSKIDYREIGNTRPKKKMKSEAVATDVKKTTEWFSSANEFLRLFY